MKCRMIMTVVFDKPFYKGIFERFVDDRYAVAEINLGTSLPKTRDISISFKALEYSSLFERDA